MAGEPEPGGGAGVPLAQRAATLVATLAHSLTAAIGMAPAVLPVLPWVLAFNVWQALAGLLAAKPAVLLGTAVLLLGALLLAAMLYIMWATFGVLQRSLTRDSAVAAQMASLQVSSGANSLVCGNLQHGNISQSPSRTISRTPKLPLTQPLPPAPLPHLPCSPPAAGLLAPGSCQDSRCRAGLL